jgi:DNA helicase-2/ATP-dependent DNA helicase PcrA
MDTIAWNRVLMLLDGIGPKTAQDLFEWIRLAKNPYDLGINETVSKAYINQLKILSKLLQCLKKEDLSVSEVIDQLVDYYRNFCEKRYDDYPKRLKDLEAFVSISSGFKSLPKMLEELALEPITATAIETEEKEQEESPLILSTIHSSKGLEWRHVFIIQCLDGIIPSAYSVEDKEQLDEELRLLYVATTRAKDMLYYTYPVLAQSAYGDYFTNPSRFLKELSSNTLEEWVIEEERAEELKSAKSDELLSN